MTPSEVSSLTSDLRFSASYLSANHARELFTALLEGLNWQQNSIRMFGKDIPEPRLSVWMGDADACYRYSGRSHEPEPWHPLVAQLRDRLQKRLGAPFNSVLVNLYRDQRDSMGWHADNEKELGEQPCIASVSLGETRRFVLRHAQLGRLQYQLGEGSLLIMSGKLQAEWRHSVPKETQPRAPRINLTFRQILPPS